MGNSNTKNNETSVFSSEEMKVLEPTFRAISGHSEKLTKEKLLSSWSHIDPLLAQWTMNFLFTMDGQNLPTISFRRFAHAFYVVNRGTFDERADFIALSLDSSASNFPARKIENYITAVLKSFLNTQTQQTNSNIHCWLKLGYTSSDRSILPFSKVFVRSNSIQSSQKEATCDLERWLHQNPIFLNIWNEVFTDLYSTYGGKTHKFGDRITSYILPRNEGIPSGTQYMPILDLPHVIYINSNLPSDKRKKWRFLFSSKIHGESFSTMLGKICNKGATVFIIEDEDHFIFGGYAPTSWSLSPNFVGDDSSMLFTISPALRCFSSTGYNDHYQYMNLNQQTMPNGLGMGGQFNFWGLWIDCEYGIGQSSESCTTYRDYVQLSKRKEFKIRNMEVWGVGDEPVPEVDLQRPNSRGGSILDKSMEDRVMLELSGKKMHSDGLREPLPED